MDVRRCIIFDNEDQSDTITKLIKNAKQNGIILECEQFNVGSTEFTEVLTEGKIDINKVVPEFLKRYAGKTFHIAAFDWQLDDDDINGIELIRQLVHNRILKNTPKIIFSGLLDQVLTGILKIEGNNRLKQLTALVNNDIRGYCEREKYEIDILTFLLKNEETLDLILEQELEKFPELTFENRFINEKFAGKTYPEISDILKGNVHIANEFKKEIIQQVLAYLTIKV